MAKPRLMSQPKKSVVSRASAHGVKKWTSTGGLLAIRTRGAGPHPTSAPLIGLIDESWKTGLARVKWKGTRVKGGQTTGFPLVRTPRNPGGWSAEQKASKGPFEHSVLVDRAATGPFQTMSELSHVIAASMGGPNDAESAFRAMATQNTEALAIESAIRAIGQRLAGHDIRMKNTAYVSPKTRSLGYMRHKLIIDGKKVLDYLTSGSRGPIDYAEASGLQAKIEALGPGSKLLSNHLTSSVVKGIPVGVLPPRLVRLHNRNPASKWHPFFTPEAFVRRPMLT